MQNLRLMVVDPDDFEAMLTGAALSELGHRVDKFASAEVALEALHHMRGAYDAVVAEKTLDTMTGAEFAKEARLTDSKVIVLRKADLLADLAAAVEQIFQGRGRLLAAAA